SVMAVEVFFFQAEDGIGDWSVTGVQTCALPILEVGFSSLGSFSDLFARAAADALSPGCLTLMGGAFAISEKRPRVLLSDSTAREIGRASCRERGESAGADRSLEEDGERDASGGV